MTRKIVIESPESVDRTQPLLAESKTMKTAKSDPSIITMKVNGDGNPNSRGSINSVNVNVNGRSHGHRCSKVGEAVGGTAAVCCCCPCAALHLLVLAVYRLPTGLCRKAWRKKKSIQRRRLLKKNSSLSLDEQPNLTPGPKPIGLGMGLGLVWSDDEDDDNALYGDGLTEMDSLDVLMWEQFYRGFWRSPSQKEDD